MNKQNPDQNEKKKLEYNNPYGHSAPSDDEVNFPYASTQNYSELDIQAASAMECTGLIPALPSSEAELESYAQLFHFPADIYQD